MDWPLQTNSLDVAERLRQASQRWEMGAEFQWVIEEKEQNSVIGTISCRIRGHRADFGYFLRRSSWGKGFAFEAGSLLLDWLKQEQGVLRIWASVDAGNTRSILLLNRLGLQLEGLLRMATIRPNISPIPRDTKIFAYCKNGTIVNMTASAPESSS